VCVCVRVLVWYVMYECNDVRRHVMKWLSIMDSLLCVKKALSPWRCLRATAAAWCFNITCIFSDHLTASHPQSVASLHCGTSNWLHLSLTHQRFSMSPCACAQVNTAAKGE